MDGLIGIIGALLLKMNQFINYPDTGLVCLAVWCHDDKRRNISLIEFRVVYSFPYLFLVLQMYHVRVCIE